jgi:hypothetical protein
MIPALQPEQLKLKPAPTSRAISEIKELGWLHMRRQAGRVLCAEAQGTRFVSFSKHSWKCTTGPSIPLQFLENLVCHSAFQLVSSNHVGMLKFGIDRSKKP